MRERPAPGVPAIAPRPLTDREFALFQALIQREVGIHLGPTKKALLVGRLSSRLRMLGLDSFGAYYNRVIADGEPELTRMLDAICTNETHFFREPAHFALLEQRIYPEWRAAAAEGRRGKHLRVWSAACSTGEEPYSLAMTLLTHFPREEGWTVEVLGTDLSTKALHSARSGLWSKEKAREIPPHYLKSYMLRGVGEHEGRIKAAPGISAVVRFERINLNAERYPAVRGTFDLIFCRNVLIYFGADAKQYVVQKLLNYLAPSGYLFVGHAEGLSAASRRTRAIMPTVYVHAHAVPERDVIAPVARRAR